MKKLMIAAAIVCAAAMAQAATVNWTTATAMMGPNIDLANMKAGTGIGAGTTTMQNFTAITWTYTLDLSNGSGQTDSLVFNADNPIVWKASTGRVNTPITSDVIWTPASAELPANVVSYTLTIEGKYKDGSGTEWTISTDPLVEGSVPYSYAGGLTSFNMSTLPSSWTVTSSAVPEPTSGLLLLLGVAGLALRRKQK